MGLADYLLDVSEGRTADYMRPAFWPTTPDILAGPLRDGHQPRSGCALPLAALDGADVGLLLRLRLRENVPASADQRGVLRLGEVRAETPRVEEPRQSRPVHHHAQRHPPAPPRAPAARGAWVHTTDNDQLLAFSRIDARPVRRRPRGRQRRPWNVQSGWIHLDLEALGIPADEPYDAVDELTGDTFEWSGAHPWVRLDPDWTPGHVLHLTRRPTTPGA